MMMMESFVILFATGVWICNHFASLKLNAYTNMKLFHQDSMGWMLTLFPLKSYSASKTSKISKLKVEIFLSNIQSPAEECQVI